MKDWFWRERVSVRSEIPAANENIARANSSAASTHSWAFAYDHQS